MSFALPECLLRLLAVSDVDEDPLPVERLSRLVPHEGRLIPDPHDSSVLGDQAILFGEGLTRSLGAFVGGQHPHPVLRVKPLFPQVPLGIEPLLNRIAHQSLDLRAGVDGEVRISAEGPIRVSHHRDGLDQGAVTLLDRPRALLGLFAPGDVPDHRYDADEAAVLAEDRRVGPLHRKGGAVPAPHLELPDPGLPPPNVCRYLLRPPT